MNKKQFWMGTLITCMLLLSILGVVGAVEKRIVVELDFYMDEETFNESVDYVMETYNMTPTEYLEFDIPRDWELWYTNELKKDMYAEYARISNTNNNTLIKEAITQLELIE